MKTLKKLATLSAAVIMAATAAVPATFMTGFAASSTHKITINSSDVVDSLNVYTAYQVFSGDVYTDGTISNVEWGSGVDGTNLLSALKADGTLSSYFTSCTTAAQVAEAIKDFDTNNTNAFANIVSAYLSTGTDSTDGVISNLNDGYYFVKTKTAAAVNGLNTKYILTLVGADTEVNRKGDLASVEKKVWQEDDGVQFEDNAGKVINTSWQDTADAEVGETVSFKLEAKLPSNLDDYKAFYFKLSDELSDGLSINDSTYTPKYYVVHGSTATELTSGINANVKSNKTVEFECFDAKKLTGVQPGDSIVVVYQAELGEGFQVTPTTGNDNAVTLKYSNNPYSNYDGTSSTPPTEDTGETPKDEVRVLTYELDITKVNGDNVAEKLSGAKFSIKNGDNKYATFDANGNITGWVETYNESACTVTTTESTGLAVIKGLDKGTYTLTEEVTPAGYNKPNPFTVVIDSTLTKEVTAFSDGTNPLTQLTIKVDQGNVTNGDVVNGTVAATIENNKGSSLPGTGGMGTTIFYVGGGILVVASGALLISKKRMKNKEN